MATQLSTESIQRAVRELEGGQFVYAHSWHEYYREARSARSSGVVIPVPNSNEPQVGVRGVVTMKTPEGDLVVATFRANESRKWEPLQITTFVRLAATFEGIPPIGLIAAVEE